MINQPYKERYRAPVRIRDLAEGYTNDQSTGEIRCFGGNLNPRPSYQREFVYTDGDQEKVFATIYRGFPLGLIYWSANGDGTFEVVDGQQRILSILNIVNNKISIQIGEDHLFFEDLPDSTKDAILDYELTVYVCEGDVNEKMEWFRAINIAGKALTAQELRSAIYSSPFVTDARNYFVGKARTLALAGGYGRFVSGSGVDRQALLEQVFLWKADNEGIEGSKDKQICEYLRSHRSDEDAIELWRYYEDVLRWAKRLFGDSYEREQQKVEWGLLYNRFREQSFDSEVLKARVQMVMENPELEKKEGAFEFALSGDLRVLSPRAFKESDKRTKYEATGHRCAICGGDISDIRSAHADHIVPWSRGGRTDWSNLQILCVRCNLAKSDEEEAQVKEIFGFEKK